MSKSLGNGIDPIEVIDKRSRHFVISTTKLTPGLDIVIKLIKLKQVGTLLIRFGMLQDLLFII